MLHRHAFSVMGVLQLPRPRCHPRDMRLRFDPETDEIPFAEARLKLLERFDTWLAGRSDLGASDADEAPHDTALALDWKFSYADGDLGWWRVEHLQEFLLEWCPRKLSASAEEVRSLPSSLARFVAFLDAEELLAPGSASPAAVTRAAEALRPGFLSAMSDPSKFGMAKSLFAGAAAEGADLTDRDQLDAWMAEFNSRPDGERRRLLPDSSLPRPPRPKLAPVAMPSEEAVAASKAVAPVLAMFAKLAKFVGSGRRLTQKGNFNLADARELVKLLGTGDTVDHQYGGRVHQLRSAEDLPVLRYVFAWAKKAGVVRVVHGKVVTTKKGTALASDPAKFFDHAVESLLAAGPLSIQRYPDRWGGWPEVDAMLDQFTLALLTGPYCIQRPMRIEALAEEASGAVLKTFVFAHLGDDDVTRHIGWDVTDMMDILVLAGMIQRDGVEPPDEPWARRGKGGTVELTPAGISTTRRLLAEAGYDVPEAGVFAEASAAELLLGTDHSDFPTVWGELQAWRARRSPEEAVAQLADAVLEMDDPALRNVAMAVMSDTDQELAVPHVRRLCEDRRSRGFALCWLVDHEIEPPGSLYQPDDPEPFVDVLAHRLVSHGPEAMIEALELAGSHEAQITLIGRLWRTPSDATVVVLSAIGSEHPSKVVAKAARRAAFQRRSWSPA